MNFINYLHELNIVSTIVRIALAIVCGGILGLERKKAQHSAGMRTYMLVCMGAAMVSMTSHYMYNYFSASHPDVERLGAQVVSGVAVLAASVIVVSKRNSIKGLTTAADMWASACIGLALGIGFYSAGLIGTVAVYIIMTYFHRIETKIILKSNDVELNVIASEKSSVLEVVTILGEQGVELRYLQFEVDNESDFESGLTSGSEECMAVLNIHSKTLNPERILASVKSVKGVKNVWFDG